MWQIYLTVVYLTIVVTLALTQRGSARRKRHRDLALDEQFHQAVSSLAPQQPPPPKDPKP